MSRFVKTDREQPTYVNVDHIIYAQLVKLENEGVTTYRVVGCIDAAGEGRNIIMLTTQNEKKAKSYISALQEG